MLVAGGDTGGKLGGIINLATSTVSDAAAQVFDTTGNTFALVGSLATPREAAATVALPNGLTLILGGQTCAPMTFGAASGFLCTALQSSELYNENTKTFTPAGTGGAMTIARSGPSATLISGCSCPFDGKVLIVGGSTGSSFLTTATPPPPAAPPGQQALSTAEVYDPALDKFTATASLPACAAGTFPPACTNGVASVCPGPTSAIASAAESSNTVTITMSTANPTGLTVSAGVSIAGNSVAGYNGSFTVLTIPDSTHFTYSDPTSGLGAGTGGTAAADTSECGMVDQGAALIPNDGGKVLLAGGDILQFLGASSNTSFIFDPAGPSFTRTTGSMTNARELFPLVGLESPVTGPLAGHVVAFGGIQATSQNCLSTPSTPVVATTLNSAEVFDPSAQTWSATANNMGVKRTTPGTLFKTGSKAGMVILPGGVDVEAGTPPSTCTGTTGIKQGAQSAVDLYDPTTGTGGTFSATGSLNAAREGQAQAVIGSGSDITDLIAIGGACTTPSPSLQSVVIGTTQANTTCVGTQFLNDYSELYSQGAGTWAVGPSFATGGTSTITSTAESGTTVTVTMASANPTGLTIGRNVTLAGVNVTGYNGNFTVTAIPTGTTFQYVNTVSGLAAGSGGTAAAAFAPSNGAAYTALP